MRNYPKWFSAALIGVTATGLFLSGLILAPTTLEMRLEWEVLWRLEGNTRILIAALHASLAFLMVWILGALWSLHMRQEWKSKRNRLSGLLLTVCWLVLVASGVAIYYVGNEIWAVRSSVIHLVFGILVFIFYSWHVLAYRGVRKIKNSK